MLTQIGKVGGGRLFPTWSVWHQWAVWRNWNIEHAARWAGMEQ